MRKPDWLKIALGNNDTFSATKQLLEKNHLHTICQSGRCPNMGECWNKGTATFMIAGEICTRSCKFCNTLTGKPLPLDETEPAKVAEAIHKMSLKHAVITSVDRDDLPDYGANHWATTIRTIKAINPAVTMEVLIPDFNGNTTLLDLIIAEKPDIISHNMETVRRLTPQTRSVAKYDTSLQVLQYISDHGIATKSGIMVGLGETKEEVFETMKDLLKVNCLLLSIGQYLQPSKKNISVSEYVKPEVFEEYRDYALSIGFKHIRSAPLVRSSYHSVDFL